MLCSIERPFVEVYNSLVASGDSGPARKRTMANAIVENSTGVQKFLSPRLPLPLKQKRIKSKTSLSSSFSEPRSEQCEPMRCVFEGEATRTWIQGVGNSPIGQAISRRSRRFSAHNDVKLQLRIAQRISEAVTSFQGTVEPPQSLVNSRVPKISLELYVDRLIRQFNRWAEEADGPSSIGVRCAVMAVGYVKRANLKLSPECVHRCFLGAYLLGIKLIYDYYMSNSYWASVGGVSAKELNQIESAFCACLNWSFAVSPTEHDLEFRNLSIAVLV